MANSPFCLCIALLILGVANGNLYDIKSNLTKAILKDYTPSVDPRATLNEPIRVLVTPYITQIVGMDTKKQLLTVNMMNTMIWKDPRLTWDSNKYKAESLTLPLEKIWSPSVTPYNDVSLLNKHHDLDKRGLEAVVKPDGTVKVSVLKSLKVHCEMAEDEIFYDKQQCTIYFVDWNRDINSIHLGIDRTFAVSPFIITHYDWQLLNASLSSHIITVKETGLTVSYIKVDLMMERRSLASEFHIIAPAMLILLLVALSYLLPADGGERIFLCMTSLLAFIIMLFFVSDWLLTFVIACIIITCITLFLNIININLYTWAYLDYRCPRGIVDFLNYPSHRWFLSSPDKNTVTYQTEETVAVRKTVYGWVELSRFLDRLFFILTFLVSIGMLVWILSKN